MFSVVTAWNNFIISNKYGARLPKPGSPEPFHKILDRHSKMFIQHFTLSWGQRLKANTNIFHMMNRKKKLLEAIKTAPASLVTSLAAVNKDMLAHFVLHFTPP